MRNLLSHGDDPYNAYARADYPAKQFLIDQHVRELVPLGPGGQRRATGRRRSDFVPPYRPAGRDLAVGTSATRWSSTIVRIRRAERAPRRRTGVRDFRAAWVHGRALEATQFWHGSTRRRGARGLLGHGPQGDDLQGGAVGRRHRPRRIPRPHADARASSVGDGRTHDGAAACVRAERRRAARIRARPERGGRPDLVRRDLTGLLEQWIEVGLPDEREVRKACGRAREVIVYAYGGRASALWWDKLGPSLHAPTEARGVGGSPGGEPGARGLRRTGNEDEVHRAGGSHPRADGENSVAVDLPMIKAPG